MRVAFESIHRVGKIKEMVSRVQTGVLFFVLTSAGTCVAQKYEPLPPPLTVDPCAVKPNPRFPVTPDPKAAPVVCPPPTTTTTPAATPPSSADAFPFPGDAPQAKAPASAVATPSTADQFPFPGSTPAPPPSPKAGSTGDQFPYPGETSKSPDAVPEGDTPRYVPDSPAAGSGTPPSSGSSSSDDSSSSSSSGSSSSSDSVPSGVDDARKAADADDTAAPVRARRRLPKVSAQSSDDRVAEDLSVAKFYSDRGNFQAAYLRTKDAIKAMPDDPESHFALAQAAEKLQKKDEAAAEYTAYLKLEPSGERKAAAQRALAGLR